MTGVQWASASNPISVNSSPPSAAYMRQWTGSALVQIMACRLFSAKPYLSQCWLIVNWTLRDKFHWNFSRNSNIFIQENAFKNGVCEMASIFFGFNVLMLLCRSADSSCNMQFSCYFKVTKHMTAGCQGQKSCCTPSPRGHFVYAFSQSETMLHCNIISHWLDTQNDPC